MLKQSEHVGELTWNLLLLIGFRMTNVAILFTNCIDMWPNITTRAILTTSWRAVLQMPGVVDLISVHCCIGVVVGMVSDVVHGMAPGMLADVAVDMAPGMLADVTVDMAPGILADVVLGMAPVILADNVVDMSLDCWLMLLLTWRLVY